MEHEMRILDFMLEVGVKFDYRYFKNVVARSYVCSDMICM